MRIPRIYVSQDLSSAGEVALGEPPSHHLITVLRMKEGRELTAFNGNGYEYPAKIIKADKKRTIILTKHKVERANSSPLYSDIAVGMSKGDRLDWVIQKATELGVNSISPLYTSRCEIKLDSARMAKKMNSWSQIAISACEQSQRNTIPTINSPIALEHYLNACEAEERFVLHHHSAHGLKNGPPPRSVSLLIGPEGGLAEDEIANAQSRGFRPLALGNRILRTETAPIAALAILQFMWGDLGPDI